MVNYDFLPKPLRRLALSGDLYELRLRAGKQACANILGKQNFLEFDGVPYVCSSEEIEHIVAVCAKNSLYAQNDNLSRGYIACSEGVRVGVAGECVYSEGKNLTIKNFSSLCIRFAREVKGCGELAYKLTQSSGDASVLIISPPGVGKTTLLRDLARLISINKRKNVLVVDDKDEIALQKFDLGSTCDVIKLCDKRFGFYSAVKTLSPDFVIADELVYEDDVVGATFASLSGVKTICSVHGKNYADVCKKKYMEAAVKNKCFDYFITLEKFGSGFRISEFCNREGELLCLNL